MSVWEGVAPAPRRLHLARRERLLGPDEIRDPRLNPGLAQQRMIGACVALSDNASARQHRRGILYAMNAAVDASDEASRHIRS